MKKRNRGSLVLGCVLLMLPMIAVTVDAKNNWDFASSISIQAGMVAIACAVGLSALPGVLAMRDWTRSMRWMLWFVTGVCAIATTFAAANAYLTRQGHAMAAGRAQQQAYDNNNLAIESARQTASAARAEARRVTETASIDELELLRKEASEKAQREAARVRCAERCELAKQEYANVLERLGQAKAKAAALLRAENAEKRVEELVAVKHTPVQPNIMAIKIAGWANGNVQEIEEWVAIVLDSLWIIATLAFAPLAYPAIVLIRQGIGGGDEKPIPMSSEVVRVPAKINVPKAIPIARTIPPKTIKSSNSASTDNTDKLFEEFFDECVKNDGGEMTSDVLYTAFQRWCKQVAANVVPGQRKLAAYMASRGVGSVKRGGRMVYPVYIATPPRALN